MTLPTAPVPVLYAADLVVRIAGEAATVVTVTWPEDATGAGPDGGVPVTDAVFFTKPASTSVCFTVYVAVAVTDAPGASEVVIAGLLALNPLSGSLIVT